MPPEDNPQDEAKMTREDYESFMERRRFDTATPAPNDIAECCCKCLQPTGRAGRGEDSIYCDHCDSGPYCEECADAHDCHKID